MAEPNDKESRTEEPTDKRIRDAIEKGNVPVSREASTFASLIGMLVVASLFFGGSVAQLQSSLAYFIDNPGGWTLENGSDAVELFQTIGLEAARLLAPALAVLAVAGISASVLQNSPSLVAHRIQPDASRISLVKGWKRVFGIHGQVEFLRAAFKFSVICLVAVLLLRSVQYDVLNAMYMEPTALGELILATATQLIAGVTVATTVLVAADLVWSRVSWQRNLRMTRQEIKDELKQSDGDPIVKARMRSLARDRLRKRMIAAVPRATLVIANPTHYAVALRYVREEGGAPLVVAKGKDLIALRIRQVAEEHGIPVIEDKALARSLYDAVEVDRLIPPEFYKAVAQIIFFLFTRGKQQMLGA
jgi:flagellar biosynthetic protein FlhB